MLKVQIDAKDLQRVMQRLPGAVKEEMLDGLDHASRKFLSVFAQRRLNAPVWHKSSPSQGIVKGRSKFFKSFRKMLIPNEGGGYGVLIHSSSQIAKAQEEGFTAGGGGQGVPVPLSEFASETMTAQGRVKKSLWNLSRRRDIRPIKFKGQVYLTRVFKGAMEREVQPLFVIKPAVEVKPHLEFYSTFESVRPQLFQILAKSIIKGVQRASANG